MMRRLTLTQRLSALVAALLLACGSASVALQASSSERHAQEIIQRLSLGLAAHFAADENNQLLSTTGFNEASVHALFDKLMAVNPSVEVYLLTTDGRIAAHAAPPGHLQRDHVDLRPLRALLGNAPLPVLGDDPRSLTEKKVFSAAPLKSDGRERGYVYVILTGETHEALSNQLAREGLFRTSLWSMLLIAFSGLLSGLIAVRWITRPLRELTADVRKFKASGAGDPQTRMAAPGSADRDEIIQLRQAFEQMTQRIAAQWQALCVQDQQRRELVANISHDLRTPLTSLHGYLETLRLKSDVLSEEDQSRYLGIAIAQSRKVGLLAQALFELARLEHGDVKADKTPFSLGDLVQDVFQKFELAAESRRQQLLADIEQDLPVVEADLGMIERVLTNLLDNAIRHTPEGGQVVVRLRRCAQRVEVLVMDSGPGVPEPLRQTLFTRPSLRGGWNAGAQTAGGLGLLIVRRILQLHDSDIQLHDAAAFDSAFRFELQASSSPT